MKANPGVDVPLARSAEPSPYRRARLARESRVAEPVLALMLQRSLELFRRKLNVVDM